MDRSQYYKAWWRYSTSGAYRRAERITFWVAIAGGAVTYKWPHAVGVMTHLLWAIPLAVFAGTLVIGLIVAPYALHHKEENSWIKTNRALREKRARENRTLKKKLGECERKVYDKEKELEFKETIAHCVRIGEELDTVLHDRKVDLTSDEATKRFDAWRALTSAELEDRKGFHAITAVFRKRTEDEPAKVDPAEKAAEAYEAGVSPWRLELSRILRLRLDRLADLAHPGKETE